MKSSHIAICISLLPLGGTYADTAFYQCTDKWGQPVFSQQSCGDDAILKIVDEPQMTGGFVSSTSTWARVSADNALRDAERAIERHEDRLRRHQYERDRRITELRHQGTIASNNLAGAQYRESLATEMQAVNQQYDARIRSTQLDIDRLQQRIDNVRDAALDIQ